MAEAAPAITAEEAASPLQPPTPQPAGRGGTALLWLLVVDGFAISALASCSQPFLPVLLERRGTNSGLVGAVLGADALCNFLTTPFSPRLCRTLGRRATYLLALSLELAAALALGNAGVGGSAPLLILLFGLSGVGANASYTALVSTAAAAFPDTLARATSSQVRAGRGPAPPAERYCVPSAAAAAAQEAAMGVGYVAGPPIGGALYKALGFRAPYSAAAIALAAAAPLAIWALPAAPPPPPPPGANPRSPAPPAAPSGDGGKARVSLSKVLRLPGFPSTLGTAFVSGGVLGYLAPELTPHWANTLGSTPAQSGLLLMAAAIVYVVVAIIVGTSLAERPDRFRHSMVAGLVLISLSYFLFGILQGARGAGGWAAAALVVSLVGAGAGLAMTPGMPTLQQLVAGKFSDGDGAAAAGGGGDERAAGLEAAAAMYSGAMTLGQGSGPLLGGGIAAAGGFRVAMFAAGAAMGAGAFAASWALPRLPRRPLPAGEAPAGGDRELAASQL